MEAQVGYQQPGVPTGFRSEIEDGAKNSSFDHYQNSSDANVVSFLL
jgi:hypothetical protein